MNQIHRNQRGSVGLIVMVLVVIGIAIYFMFVQRDATGTPPAAPPVVLPGNMGEQVTVVGEMGCLPHKDQGGPQTLECAFGLLGDDTNYYGLLDLTNDYSIVMKLVGGHRYRISGILREAPTNNIYTNIALIEILKYVELDPATGENVLEVPQ